MLQIFVTYGTIIGCNDEVMCYCVWYGTLRYCSVPVPVRYGEKGMVTRCTDSNGQNTNTATSLATTLA